MHGVEMDCTGMHEMGPHDVAVDRIGEHRMVCIERVRMTWTGLKRGA